MSDYIKRDDALKLLHEFFDSLTLGCVAYDDNTAPAVYAYPQNVLTAAMLGYIAKHGVDLTVRYADVSFTRALDDQRRYRKSIYGAGYLF